MIIIAVISDGKGEWEEKFSCPDNATDDQVWDLVEGTLINFNRTLRPGESVRTVVDVFEEIGGDKSYAAELVRHQWVKSNLVTVMSGHSSYDTYRCEKCGVTGKRYGLDPTIVVDKKFVNKPCKL